MFAKITTGSVVAGLIEYMHNVSEKDARILYAKDLCTDSHEAICASFKLRAAMNNSITDKVVHIALSFSENDKNKTQSDEFMIAFAQDYLKRMGWGDSQHIVIRHCDHDYDHLHIAMNASDENGDSLDMKFYRKRSKSVCFSMTKDYGLYFAPKSKKNVNRNALKGKEKLKYEIADIALPLLDKHKSLREFRKALLESGVKSTIIPRKDGSGLGIVYTLVDHNFSIGGKKCDDALKFSSLAKRLDISDDVDVQNFESGRLVRPADGKLTEALSNEQAQDLAFGDDFPNIVYSTYTMEDLERERREWEEAQRPQFFDANDAFDPSLAKPSDASEPQEESHLGSKLLNAALEVAVGGTHIAPSPGGGGGSDNSWDRDRRKNEIEEAKSKRRRGRGR